MGKIQLSCFLKRPEIFIINSDERSSLFCEISEMKKATSTLSRPEDLKGDLYMVKIDFSPNEEH